MPLLADLGPSLFARIDYPAFHDETELASWTGSDNIQRTDSASVASLTSSDFSSESRRRSRRPLTDSFVRLPTQKHVRHIEYIEPDASLATLHPGAERTPTLVTEESDKRSAKADDMRLASSCTGISAKCHFIKKAINPLKSAVRCITQRLWPSSTASQPENKLRWFGHRKQSTPAEKFELAPLDRDQHKSWSSGDDTQGLQVPAPLPAMAPHHSDSRPRQWPRYRFD